MFLNIRFAPKKEYGFFQSEDRLVFYLKFIYERIDVVIALLTVFSGV